MSYHIAGKFGGGMFGEFTSFKHLVKKVWQKIDQPKGY